jgi:hypothetical protein
VLFSVPAYVGVLGLSKFSSFDFRAQWFLQGNLVTAFFSIKYISDIRKCMKCLFSRIETECVSCAVELNPEMPRS